MSKLGDQPQVVAQHELQEAGRAAVLGCAGPHHHVDQPIGEAAQLLQTPPGPP